LTGISFLIGGFIIYYIDDIRECCGVPRNNYRSIYEDFFVTPKKINKNKKL